MKSCQDKAPRTHKDIKKFVKKGLILVYTGDGKGKSTSAFGTALRIIGRGYKVAIVQFIKGNWKTGEAEFFKKFVNNHCDLFIMGEGFTWDTKSFAKDVKTASQAWKKCCQLLHDPKYHLVIFDEINYVMNYNFLAVKEVVQALQRKPKFKHVILTGRDAPKEIIELADLVTDMRAVKHPYQKDVKAQPGIDY